MEFTGGLIASDTTNGVRSNSYKALDGTPFLGTLGVIGACFPEMEFYQSVLVRSGNDLTLDGGSIQANELNAHQGPLSLGSASGVI